MGYLDFLHGGNIYAVKRKYAKEVIDFSANINPLGLPANVKKAIYANFDGILHYPDPEAKNITRRIAQYWRVKEENVLVGNGSAELIYLIMHAFRPTTTIIAVPTFSEYERAARCTGSRVSFKRLLKEKNFQLPELNSKSAEALFLCNPNNPTGNLIIEERNVVKNLPAKLIIVDEAFMDFLPDEKNYTLIKEAHKNKKIVVLRTFTKFFALAGLRIGYLVAHQDVIKKLKAYRIPWSVNAFAQLAAEMILEDREYIRKTRQLIEKERRFLFNEIARIRQLIPYPSVANFLLVKIDKGRINSDSLRKKLLARSILVRDCSNFRSLTDRFIRVAVRNRPENKQLVKALREIFQNGTPRIKVRGT